MRCLEERCAERVQRDVGQFPVSEEHLSSGRGATHLVVTVHQLRQLLGQGSLRCALMGSLSGNCDQRVDLGLGSEAEGAKEYRNVSIVGVPKCAIMAFGGGTVAMNGGGIETTPEVFDALVWVAGKGSKASLTGCALKVHGGKSSLATMDDGELAVSSCSLNGEALAWRANAGYPFGNGGKSWSLPGAKNK